MVFLAELPAKCVEHGKQIRSQFSLWSGAPPKLNTAMLDRIEQLTFSNGRSTNIFIANILSNKFAPIYVSEETVRKARKELGFKFQMLIHTFDLTAKQKENQFEFAHQELEETRAGGRDWTKIVFTDENYFHFGDDLRRLWRKPDEKGSDVCVHMKKNSAHIELLLAPLFFRT
jgi:hypothetical protein